MNISIRTEEFNVAAVVARHAEIVNNVLLIEGLTFGEFCAANELTPTVLASLSTMAKRLAKMGPTAMHGVEFNIAEKNYPEFDALVKFGYTV